MGLERDEIEMGSGWDRMGMYAVIGRREQSFISRIGNPVVLEISWDGIAIGMGWDSIRIK